MALSGKRILIIEDDAINLSVFSSLLRQDGADVIVDMWGKTSPSKILEFMPDLIILDLMLPRGASGYEVADQIRAIPELSQIPILVVTAADPDVELIRARKKKLNGFLSKPIDQRTFAQCVEAVIGGQSVWGELV